MLKRLLPILAIITSVSAIGQGRKSNLESSFRIVGGYNIANISVTSNGLVDTANNLGTFHVGLIADLPISRFLSFQGGLVYTGKGAKREAGTPGQIGYAKSSTNPMYLQMPLSFVGKLPLGTSTSIIVGAGGYGALGVLGKNKTEIQTADVIVYGNKNINFVDNRNGVGPQAGYPSLKRFDYGLLGQAGIEFSRFTLTANYSHGLAKIIPGTNDNADDRGKHRVLSFSLGLRL